MKKILTLFLLIPSLSWGDIKFVAYDDVGKVKWDDYCDKNPANEEWNNKNSKTLKLREVHYSKCILEHSHESSLSRRDIKNACEVLAEDKYKIKLPEPDKFIHKTTKETYNLTTICHPHSK